MILEVAILNVLPGREAEFENAMCEARPLIEATSGFISLHLRRCIEAPNRYLLEVGWRAFDDHTIGFRQSDRYPQWRALLHHFYDPFPTVEHYGEALSLSAEWKRGLRTTFGARKSLRPAPRWARLILMVSGLAVGVYGVAH